MAKNKKKEAYNNEIGESSLETIIKWSIYIAALMPLVIFRGFLSPFHIGKVALFRSLVEIVLFLYILLIMKDRRFLPKMTFLVWSLTVFTIVYLLASITGVNWSKSIFGTFERMGGWITYFHFWIFFIVAISVLKKKEDWLLLFKVSIMASLASLVYGFLQKYPEMQSIMGSGRRLRIFGTLGNTAIFASYHLINIFFALIVLIDSWISRKSSSAYYYIFGTLLYSFFIVIPVFRDVAVFGLLGTLLPLVIFLFLLLAAYLVRKNVYKVDTIFCSLIIILSIVAILSTAVRGAVLALAVSLFVFALLYLFSGVKGARKIGYAILTLILLGILMEAFLIVNSGAGFIKDNKYLSRMADISLSSKTVQTRIMVWKSGLDGWDDSTKTILLGWGPENFSSSFFLHFNPKIYDRPNAEVLFDRAHNMFVEILSTMGLAGFMSYLVVFIAIVVALARSYKRFRDDPAVRLFVIIAISALSAYFVNNLFFFDTSVNSLVFFLLIGFIYFLSGYGRHSGAEHIKPRRPNLTAVTPVICKVVIAVLILLTPYALYTINIRPALAAHSASGAIQLGINGNVAGALDNFEKAVSYNSFGNEEILNKEQGYATYVINNEKQIEDSGRDYEDLVLALVKREKEIADRGGNNPTPYLFIARLYIMLGKDDSESQFNSYALDASKKAIELSPNYPRAYYEAAQAYLNKGDIDAAIGYFKQAVDLNPDVGISWWYMGVLQLRSGDIEAGAESVKKAFENRYAASEEETMMFANMLINRGEYEYLPLAYRRMIILKPGDPKNYVILASVYKKIGDNEKALVTAKKGMELFPWLEPEWQKFIDSLE